MNIYLRSIIAGFVATVVLSLLMIMKSAMGMMPQLDVVSMLGGMAQRMTGAGGPAMGWLIHFLIGTVLWGVLFALLHERLPGTQAVIKGLSFSVLAWLLMMILAMPMAGAGFFGVRIGIMAPVATLILHLVWGAVLGIVFQFLPSSPEAVSSPRT
ncbi:MAG TPA: DUF6789 family protein [Alphaproteobacteria bacterium]|jgi:uncharacterized membrane protein YagU involved in acid resistance|nr:DUF6789 family protein [Alphaproteobacteria bacterium]